MKTTQGTKQAGFRQTSIFAAVAAALNANVNARIPATADDQGVIKADDINIKNDAITFGATKARDFDFVDDATGAETKPELAQAKQAITPSGKSGFDAIMQRMNRAGAKAKDEQQAAATALVRTCLDSAVDFVSHGRAIAINFGVKIWTAFNVLVETSRGHYTGAGTVAIGA